MNFLVGSERGQHTPLVLAGGAAVTVCTSETEREVRETSGTVAIGGGGAGSDDLGALLDVIAVESIELCGNGDGGARVLALLNADAVSLVLAEVTVASSGGYAAVVLLE